MTVLWLIEPSNALVHHFKGIALIAIEHYDDALTEFNHAHFPRSCPMLPSYYYFGIVHLQLKQYEEAVAAFDQTIALEPKGKDAQSEKELHWSSLKEMKKQSPFLSRSLKERPRDALAWCYQGISLAALGQFENAVLAFDKTIEINRLCAPAFYGKGNALASLGLYQDAISSYDRALELEPGDLKTNYP